MDKEKVHYAILEIQNAIDLLADMHEVSDDGEEGPCEFNGGEGCMACGCQVMLNAALKVLTAQPQDSAEVSQACRCLKFYKNQNRFKYCPDCGRKLP